MRIGGNECVDTLLTKSFMSTRYNRATVTRGAFKQTSHDADAGAVTTAALCLVPV